MENKKEMLSKAYKEGKIIQFDSSGEWKDFVPHNQVDFPNFDYKTDNWRIKPEDETLEEAARAHDVYATINPARSFIAGAKWQAKRMYTEEELINIIMIAHKSFSSIKGNFENWFEQFKKK